MTPNQDPARNPSDDPTHGPKTPSDPRQQGACDHFQPADLAKLAEEYLNGKSVPEDRWEGARFGYGAGGGSGPFKAVITEVERKKGQWVVVRLDRRKVDLAEAEAGFKIVKDAV